MAPTSRFPVTAHRVFSLEDQKSFAQLAGDWNPIHLDPIAARRSPFGRVIVHGIHTLLWALDTATPAGVAIDTLKATFPKPAYIDEPIDLVVEQTDELAFSLSARSGANQVLKASVSYVLSEAPGPLPDVAWAMRQPDDLDADDLDGIAGTMDLQLDQPLATQLLPALVKELRATDLALLIGTSRIVGMFCPGLYSLYSALSVGSAETKSEPGTISYRLRDFDDRFARCRILASADDRQAEISAFLRPRPTQQAAMAGISRTVPADRFGGTRALVVGGSRGLGEVAAKILAAGGAEVAISYNQGLADAESIVAEINDAGGSASSVQIDVTGDDAPLPPLFDEGPTAVLYFATPSIFVGSRGAQSPELLQRFLKFYRHGLARVVDHYAAGGTRRFYAPSSVAVEDPPPDMVEYAEAKRQQEVWAEDAVNQSGGQLHIMTTRLPRIATDQTASNMPVDNASALDVMLDELHSFIPEG